jgi:hypothetical protein
MSFNDFRKVCDLLLERDRTLNEIPSAFRESFWNNPYDEGASKVIEILASKAFGTDVSDWLFWYLFDKPEGWVTVDVGNNNYRIETDEDFYSMIEKEYFSE